MSEINHKEYQTVILAGMLHDIGKMLHRGSDHAFSGKHFKASAKFIDERMKDSENVYDRNLLRFLVEHHHSLKQDAVKDSYFVALSADRQREVWQLLKLIKKADSYSCTERDQEQPKRVDSERRLLLDSIFSLVKVENGASQKQTQPFTQIHPLSAFPEKDDQSGLDKLIDLFLRIVEALPHFTDFNDMINAWLGILESFTWSVPSDTRYEDADISLYDHLRSSAAIAACLYLRHDSDIHAGKTALESKNELILVGGDYSGIQEYIFSITNREQSGVSKRLRARSFFISAFCEVTVHRILRALDLPLVCNVFSAGGKFLLLAPYSEKNNKALEDVKLKIEKEIHNSCFDQFSFLMSKKTIVQYRRWMKVTDFFKLADGMFHDLEKEKTQKSRSVLIDEKNRGWIPESFKAKDLYDSYEGTRDCPYCGRGPAVCEDRAPVGEETISCCKVCYRDKHDIGQALPKGLYIAFGQGQPEKNSGSIRIFGDDESTDAYHVDIMWKYDKKPCHYQVQYIGEGGDLPTDAPPGCARRYIANHVPTDAEGKILTFEQIAKKSRRIEGSKEVGSELLGILKVDIDNLGLVFSKGFETGVEKGTSRHSEDRRTMSRFLTLSRMTELFFSGWVKEIMERESMDMVIASLKGLKELDGGQMGHYIKSGNISFKDIYTIYSGGDDMVLVGPWETMIVFAFYLNQQFRKFTSNNRDITLSAGLAFTKPNHPIASSVKQADELMEKSKREGKNRITFFGTTVEWEQLTGLTEFFLKIDERVKDDKSKVKTTFLHRLLGYHRLALEFMYNNKVEGLRYLSMLSYDMGRNLLSKDSGNKQSRDYILFEPLITVPPKENHLMKNLKIPLFWALLGNR